MEVGQKYIKLSSLSPSQRMTRMMLAGIAGLVASMLVEKMYDNRVLGEDLAVGA